jgi:uncharacterized lipoprotein
VKNILVIMLSLLVVACAHSPQQVTIAPVLSMEGDAYGNNRPVSVSVDDRRESKTIGSRGGIYYETSVITIKNDLSQAVLAAAKGKLAVQGFDVNTTNTDATSLVVVIEDISFEPINTTIGNVIEVRVIFLAELNSGGEKFSSSYTSKSNRKTVMAPNEEDNSELLTGLVSKTMDRMFADPKLQAFLSNI